MYTCCILGVPKKILRYMHTGRAINVNMSLWAAKPLISSWCEYRACMKVPAGSQKEDKLSGYTELLPIMVTLSADVASCVTARFSLMTSSDANWALTSSFWVQLKKYCCTPIQLQHTVYNDTCTSSALEIADTTLNTFSSLSSHSLAGIGSFSYPPKMTWFVQIFSIVAYKFRHFDQIQVHKNA